MFRLQVKNFGGYKSGWSNYWNGKKYGTELSALQAMKDTKIDSQKRKPFYSGKHSEEFRIIHYYN